MSKVLGHIGWRDMGDFASGVSLRKDDMIRYGRSTLVCLEDHVTGETIDMTKFKYLVNADGIEEAISNANTAATLAGTNGEEAGVQAEAAKQAAKDATEQAEAAKEATGIFTENFKLFKSDQYVFGIADSIGNLLFGITNDGSTVTPKGVPDDVKSRFAELEGIQVMQNSNYMFAITDASNNLLFGITWKGACVVGAIAGVCQIENYEGSEFAYAVLDSAGNLLFGVKWDGTFYMTKYNLPDEVKELMSFVNETISNDTNNEFAWRVEDKDGRILIGTYWDGTTFMPKGIPEEVKTFIEKANKRLAELEKQLANFVGGTGDWSDYSSLQIPEPRCAMVNITGISAMPTSKTADLRGYLEFWDMAGNYFKKKGIFNAQGNSSMGFIKKNWAVDICNDNWVGDDTFNLKIGDWVSQDSFHVKAYYTDFFRGVCPISYKFYDKIVKTRGTMKDRPWKKALLPTSDEIGYKSSEETLIDDISLQIDNGARCFPDGFPVIVYLNGEFYGVFSWQLKKHRDNMHQSKKKAKHIHLDGTIDGTTLFGANGDTTKIGWIPGNDNGFEIRNPKNLITMTGEDYNSDATTSQELIDETSEYYDATDSDHVNSAKVKQYILNLSTVLTEIKTAEDSGSTSDEMRTLIEKYFDPENIIDYLIAISVVRDGDSLRKNWQWITYDGVKWYVMPYDMDGSFGAYHIGNYIGSPSGSVLGYNSYTIPTGWVYKYYTDELKARYAELRASGVISYDTLYGIVKDWIDRIGGDFMEAEYEKWPESPCNRDSEVNTDYWTRSSSYVSATWSEATTYSINTKVNRNSKVYNSLVSSNVGNAPETDDGTHWEDVTYDETKTYSANDTCYFGKSRFYQFKALQETTGNAPLNAFYTTYPYELGHRDSQWRISNFIAREIELLDTYLGYTAS